METVFDVAAAVIEYKYRYLVLKRANHKENAGLWEFPGGKVEAGETPGQALERELAEELAIRRAAGTEITRYRYAYPSGHTTAATAIGVATAAAIADELPRSQRILLWSTVAAFALSVGWSRLYLDEHWLDDVVGGWLAGTFIGLGAASLDARLS